MKLKEKRKPIKKLPLLIFFLLLGGMVTFGLIVNPSGQRIGRVLGEQVDGSPDSGATSRIKTIYDSLVTLGYGSNSAGSWGD